jgi:dCTP deaminase
MGFLFKYCGAYRMILTGPEISALRSIGQIVIEPYSPEYLEPNSYAFHLGEKLIEYQDDVVDSRVAPNFREISIPNHGYVLQPRKFYLGHTLEKIGGLKVTSELFANLSTASMGMWVQTSAPLGHVGAVIQWTLEICVAQRVRVYPGMKLGKICFWQNFGDISPYRGRYAQSTSVVASKSFMD